MVKGESALPMTDDVTDLEKSDEEYFYRVVSGINAKPENYEEKIPPWERQTAYHRGMRIKVKHPARNRKSSPNRIVGEGFERFTEKKLEDLPCTERTMEAVNILSGTPITAEGTQAPTPITQESMPQSRYGDESTSATDWFKKFNIKPCSMVVEKLHVQNAVDLPEVQLNEGQELEIEIQWD